jgi:predicted nucleic acid-binding protein
MNGRRSVLASKAWTNVIRMDRAFVDSMVMTDFFMATPSRLREFNLNKAKGTPTLDYTLEWFWFAVEKGIVLYTSNLCFWEICSVLTRNHIKHKRFEKSVGQIQKFFKIEEKFDPVNLALGCIFGAVTGCDIKDCYHYVFALCEEISVFISRDEKFRKGVQGFYEQTAHKETSQHCIQQMMNLYSKFPPYNDTVKEQIETGIRTLCDASKKIEIMPPEEIKEISPPQKET